MPTIDDLARTAYEHDRQRFLDRGLFAWVPEPWDSENEDLVIEWRWHARAVLLALADDMAESGCAIPERLSAVFAEAREVRPSSTTI